MSIKNAVTFSSFYVMIYIMIQYGNINMNSIIDSSDYNSFPKEFIKALFFTMKFDYNFGKLCKTKAML